LEVEHLLRGADLRVTRPRVAVLTAVKHPHADTDSIIGVVSEDLGEVSTQASYDVLRALTAAGLVRRIEPAGSVDIGACARPAPPHTDPDPTPH
jgi:Fur family ferric uptake transcriptional regulator